MIRTNYLVIPTDDRQSEELREIDLPKEPSYEQLRSICMPLIDPKNPDAHNIERVRVLYRDERVDRADRDRGGYVDMFVHDEGAIRRHSINRRATAIYRANVLLQDPDINLDTLPSLHGVAVLFLRRVWF